MSNTLTGLIPTIYKALNVVSREMVGFIPAVRGNATDQNGIATAAKDQTVRVPIAPQDDLEVIAPGTIKDSGDNTMSYVDIKMDQYYAYPIRYESEEQLSLGIQYGGILQQQFEQAFRTFAAAIEVDLGGLYAAASRAYGTAGTAPFSSSLADAAQIRKILDDNGAPSVGRSLVVNSLAGANMRSLASLNADYAAGTDQTLRQGTLLPLMGLDVKESSGISVHTKGTATDFDDVGGHVVGDTTIAVDGSDSGTILAGDVVTWVGDTNKYLVTSTTASGSTGGNIVIGQNGLRQTLGAGVEGAIGDSYSANLAFHRDAIVLASRRPVGGDEAVDEMIITDPLTGISFRLAKYAQYMRSKLEIQLLWGVKCIKPEHCAVLLG